MNGRNFEDHVNPSGGVERTDLGTSSPVVNLDSFNYKGPVLAALVQETPMGSGVTVSTTMHQVLDRRAEKR